MDKLKESLIAELRGKPVPKKLIKNIDSDFNIRERQLLKAIYKVETTVRPLLFRQFEFIYAYFKITLFYFEVSRNYNTTLGPFQIGIQTSFKWSNFREAYLHLLILVKMTALIKFL